MSLINNALYQADLQLVTRLDLPWERLQDKTVVVSGGTGLLGSFLIDVLLSKNAEGLNCRVVALGRNEAKARQRFGYCWENELFTFCQCDVNNNLACLDNEQTDYIVHLASNTHPVAYATEPVTTVMTNIIGTRNMLELARKNQGSRMVFASSNEVYGENRGDTERFDEHYCGYIDCNTLRAGYPESKRCGEALCQAYIRQYDMDVVIPRFTRSYGPTLLSSDTKALSQFLRNGLHKEDIVLKSEGTQNFSYTYMADAVAGLLYVILKGNCGEAYNIADTPSDITLRDLAALIAQESGTKVVFDLPDAVEQAGFSKATKARLDGSKLKQLGWQMHYPIAEGIRRTLTILHEANSEKNSQD